MGNAVKEKRTLFYFKRAVVWWDTVIKYVDIHS